MQLSPDQAYGQTKPITLDANNVYVILTEKLLGLFNTVCLSLMGGSYKEGCVVTTCTMEDGHVVTKQEFRATRAGVILAFTTKIDLPDVQIEGDERISKNPEEFMASDDLTELLKTLSKSAPTIFFSEPRRTQDREFTTHAIAFISSYTNLTEHFGAKHEFIFNSTGNGFHVVSVVELSSGHQLHCNLDFRRV